MADDSVTIQKVVNLTFADEGIDVITVGDGDSAWNKIVEELPDIVLADVNMPGLTGYEICERIRGNEATKNLPVMLLVGSFEPFDEDEAHRVGANGHLTKPFQSIRLLVSKVTELLDGAAVGHASFESNHVDTSAEALEPNSEPPTEDEPASIDIDELYKQSVEVSYEMRGSDPGSEEFADAGMDDEMIETNYPAVENPDSSFVDTVKVFPSPFEERVTNETAEYADQAVNSPKVESDNYPGGNDNFNFEQTQKMPDYDPRSIEILYRGAAEDGPPRFVEPPAPRFDLDESNLLELPAKKKEQVKEFITVEQAAASVRGTGAVSLSPELIDLIVGKVLEKLAEKN